MIYFPNILSPYQNVLLFLFNVSNLLTNLSPSVDSPICKSDQETTFTAVTNRPVQIQCEVEADMDDVNFRWEFNGTSSGGDVQVVSVPGTTTKSIVNYTPRSENDFGTVYCWGTNNVGTQSIPCAFVVIPAGINNQFIIYKIVNFIG
ncbi:ig-like domain-containing protein [Nephila pilipes]|uniref:Ig-like domain-containing protein n=1 Tax=Nephila pilipes TaxID=299642 RepID=A0A8X6TJ29_NEPPI|nr:ig-like domain-containing protein [Nephila pilipes]